MNENQLAILDEFFQLVERRITKTSTEMFRASFGIWCKISGLSVQDSDKFAQSLFGSTNVSYDDESVEFKIHNLFEKQEFQILKESINTAVTEKKLIDNLRNMILGSLSSEEMIKAVYNEIVKIGPESVQNIISMNKIINLIDEANRLNVPPHIIMDALKKVAIDPEVVYNPSLAVLMDTVETIN